MDKPVDIREDEEQGIKLQETMELLLAAGYFRARIKGLDPFDKVVGGMVWCLEVCNLDIDVDLMFQESLSIGQKISLTEKIVGVLPQMLCPYRLDPHQIQGLDFVHIYPVVQWLVKRAIQVREETGDTNRAYALRQFQQHYSMPEDVEREKVVKSAQDSIQRLNDVYAPKRKYRRKAGHNIPDVTTQVQYTLLEYGHKAGAFTSAAVKADESEKHTKKVSKKAKEEPRSAGDLANEEYNEMVGEMEQVDDRGRKVKASVIGGIVSQQAEQIAHMEALHQQQKLQMGNFLPEGLIALPGKQMPMSEVLSQQLEELKLKKQQAEDRKRSMEVRLEELKIEKKSLKTRKEALDQENAVLEEITSGVDEDQLELVAELVRQKDEAEEAVSSFRLQCKTEAAGYKAEYQRLREELENPTDESHLLSEELRKRLETERSTLSEVRLRLAQRNREVAQLQRSLDDVPSQAELSQYQKRFIELYDQVAAKLRETKKYYTLYNTLTDTKTYYEKEVQLLESIHDNFEVAMGSESAKEQFLRQLEAILESLRQTVTKAEKRRQNEKLKRDQLNDKYMELLEKQRYYSKLIKEFQQECSLNEDLQALAVERGLDQ
ncbi:Coiled-coil domain-containing protein 93 [Hypsibius exemplaris]|uniref:Coiled-coil domain-containing protein 93 n=1 Tax=Hypsibius exemplaris TaxID=2072580 RepID=A0A1W0WTQ9_HYPEX|nr:Coiled-coil domain-containing protein 93 [Hypsibius exemplaris]